MVMPQEAAPPLFFTTGQWCLSADMRPWHGHDKCTSATEACRASKIAVNECYSDWLRLLQLRDIKGCVTLGQVPMRGSSILLGPPGEKCDKCKLQLYGSLKNMPSKRWSCKEPLSPASKLPLFLLTISRSSSHKHSRQIAHDTQ